jgi:hypothetical protein
MAIIIPSKNIYGMDNPKIIDNVVDNVTVNSNVISKDNKYNVPVHLEKYTASSFEHAFTTDYEEWTNAATVNARSGLDAYVHYAGSAVGIRTHYANDVRVYIDRILKNAYISTLLTGYNKNGYANVNYSVVYKHYIGNAKINVTQYAMGGDNSDFVNDVQLTYNGDYETSQGNLPKLSVEKTTEYTHSNLQSAIISKAYVVQEDKTTLLDDIIKNFGDTFFSCEIKNILCGVETYYASVSGNMSKEAWGGDATSTTRNITLYGVCEKYVPIEIEITFNGNTIGINLADGSFTYGSGNKPLSLNGNELLQDNGKVGNKSLSQHLADNILQQYGNGKETATILCSISDYYDENDSKVISTQTSDKMLFAIYDEVIPTIKNEYGKDVPLSLNSNDEAKTFLVLGTRVFYDGAVWQELSLQEFASVDILRFYEVDFRAGFDNLSNRYKIAFQIKGRGQIFIDNVLIDEVYFEEPTLWKIDAEQNVLYRIKFDGDFEEISTVTKSANAIISNLGSIIDIIRWDNKMYPYMFNYQDLSGVDPTIPQYIKKIANNSFRYTTADKTYVLEIPENIQEIEALAFTESKVQSFKFNHKSGQIIKLPVSGSASGMFYSKDASEKNIYTDNEYIKNYDFVADNVTATFYHLDGTLWE